MRGVQAGKGGFDKSGTLLDSMMKLLPNGFVGKVVAVFFMIGDRSGKGEP